MREFEIILFQTQSLSTKPKRQFNFIKNTLKRLAKRLWLNFTVKGALQSDLRMCTKEPAFYDTNSLTIFWVLAKPHCCFLIIYYTLEAWKYK
jgi:hypothetical protein